MSNTAMIKKVEVEEAAGEEPQFTYTEGVLNFMKGMDDEQYQSLAEAWAQMAQGEGEGFGQA